MTITPIPHLLPLPTNLYAVSKSPDALLEFPLIIGLQNTSGSIYLRPKGLLEYAPQIADSSSFLDPYFDPATVAALAAIASLYFVFENRRRKRKKRQTIDSEDVISEVCNLIDEINVISTVGAIKLLSKKISGYNVDSPVYLISRGILNHLEGRPGEGLYYFSLFNDDFPFRPQRLNSRFNLRHAKCLAASGEFSLAKKKYNSVLNTKNLTNHEKVQAARESCNVLTQIAWQKPKDSRRWSELGRIVAMLETLLGSYVAADDREKVQKDFLQASKDEFSILSIAGGELTKRALDEMRHSIDRQVQTNPITGKNRYTQLAAGYLRIGDIERGLECATRYESEASRGNLEIALNHLVKTQAFLRDHNIQLAAESIERTIKNLDQTDVRRFRRVAWFFHENIYRHSSPAEKLAGYLWDFVGSSRYCGAFVPELPRLVA